MAQMLRALVVVALGVLLGMLIVWVVMSYPIPQESPVQRYRPPGLGPAGR